MKYQHILLTGLMCLAGCGDDNEGDTNVVIEQDDEEQQQEEQGPVNTGPTIRINNRIENNIRFITKPRVTNNHYHFNWQCTNAPTNVIHQQFIHISVRCPTMADDTNLDGVVDQAEAEQVVGPRIYALDSDVNSQRQEDFPTAGSYTYNQSIPLSTLRQYVPAGQDFAVMIYGVGPTTTLPASYASTTNDPLNLTVPITCKVFRAPARSGGTSGGTTGETTGGTTGETTGGTTGETTGGTTGETTGGTTGETTGGTTGETTGGSTGGTFF